MEQVNFKIRDKIMEHNKYRGTQMSYPSREKPLRNDDSFTQQDVNLSDSVLFFPEGFEKFFMLIYFIILPYIAGLLFLFFYIAGASYESFSSLNQDSSFLLTWVIGYEIIAVMLLLYIFKMAISFSLEERDNKQRLDSFQRPR